MRTTLASAGAGKTTGVVLRYLDLIQQGIPLRRIAGVTYTISAAAELKGRVGKGLRSLKENSRYHHLHLTDPHTVDEALKELGGATLTTIHGFMRHLLHLCAIEAGIPADFTSLEEWQAVSLFEAHARSTLYLARNDPRHPLHADLLLVGDRALEILKELFTKRALVDRYTGDEHVAPHLRLYEHV